MVRNSVECLVSAPFELLCGGEQRGDPSANGLGISSLLSESSCRLSRRNAWAPAESWGAWIRRSMAGERIGTGNPDHRPDADPARVRHGISRPLATTHGECGGTSDSGSGTQGFYLVRARGRADFPTRCSRRRRAAGLIRWSK